MRSKISTGELKVTSKMTNALTTADIAITETSRDQPNAPPDRQALMMVKPYQGMVAWPTVILALGIATAAIIMFVGTGGTVLPQVVRSLAVKPVAGAPQRSDSLALPIARGSLA